MYPIKRYGYSYSDSTIVFPTLVAIPYGIEVNIVMISFEEEQTQPRLECIYWHDEQYSNNPSLLCWICVPS